MNLREQTVGRVSRRRNPPLVEIGGLRCANPPYESRTNAPAVAWVERSETHGIAKGDGFRCAQPILRVQPPPPGEGEKWSQCLIRSFPRKRESSARLLGPRFRGDEREVYGMSVTG